MIFTATRVSILNAEIDKLSIHPNLGYVSQLLDCLTFRKLMRLLTMFTPKWSKFGTSIFSTMTMAANRHGAVNLAQGFPNFDGPDVIKNAAIEAIRGHFNQYAPSPGLIKLRELIAIRQFQTSKIKYNPDSEVTVYSGATEALFCVFQAFLNPGDEVITFAPFFDCYPAGAFSAGAKIVEVALNPKDWSFDIADLKNKISAKTKMILVNTPHNPTGHIFSRKEMESIASIVKKHNLICVTDEVYEELVYDDVEFTRMNTLEGMKERTIVISSTAKTYSFTGWKIGYTFAPEKLTMELRGIHQFTVFCSATPLQAAMCTAFEMPDSYYQKLREEYTERRDILCAGLRDLGFKFVRPSGTYFTVADYSHMSDLTDVEFSHWLTEHKKVAVIPTSVFYNDPDSAAKKQKLVRFAFCKDIETLKCGLKNLSLN
jgi:N-succinyldiaminopimelate aminotransferase